MHLPDITAPERLVLLTFQEKLGQILSDQVTSIFGNELSVERLLFGQLDQFDFREADMLLALSESSLSIARKIHPRLNHTIKGKRTINQLYLSHILELPPNQTILVVNDSFRNTMQVVNELEAYELPHTFLPFRPGEQEDVDIDWVVTLDEEPLIPKKYKQIINLGTRAVGLDSILEIKERFGLTVSRERVIANYFKTLVSMLGKQLGPASNRYISNWLGSGNEKRDNVNLDALVAESEVMQKLKARARQLAATDNPIHITGSLGAGKRLLARMIHNDSPRQMHPFNTLHCPSRPEDMLERELFGWEQGDAIYPGILEGSHLGTVCLEGIEVMPLGLQDRLIQVIKEQKLVRQGGKVFVPLDVRIITTSHENLCDLYNRQRTSRELFLHLQKSVCTLPQLSERPEDVERLALEYLETRFPGHAITMSDRLLDFMKSRRWEGDVQELYNVLSIMAVGSNAVLDMEHLPYHILLDREAIIDANASEIDTIVTRIEEHDFLPEILTILEVYQQGKRANVRYGRQTVISLLQEKGVTLTIQQLRLRLQRLQSLGLVKARKGRAGSTLSRAGENFLANMAARR